jgi:cytoskeleton-associated protein 5
LATENSPRHPETKKTAPWKQRGVEIVVAEPDVEVVAALSPRNEAFAFSPKSDHTTNPTQEKSSFVGERGGDATDPELLALLRGVSAKSAANRFDDNDNVDSNDNNGSQAKDKDTGGMLQPAHIDEPTRPPSASVSANPSPKSTSKPLPPWKRPNVKQQQTAQPDVEIVVATNAPPKRGIQSDIPSTFTGERGGAAEDPELLALLRGVSAKSAASRFDDNDNVDTNEYNGSEVKDKDTGMLRAANVDEPAGPPPAPVSANPSPKFTITSKPLPPWKRPGAKKQQTTQSDVEIVVATNAPPKRGIQSDNPSTFTGERGGAAEDPELLALLRGVSAKSAASRFDDNDNVDTNDNNGSQAKDNDTGGMLQRAHIDEPTGPPSASVSANASPESTSKPLPPWKRPGAKKQQIAQPDVEIVVATNAPPKRGIQSDIPSTFTGERGGAVEDPELLALLRGVSAKSAASRFDDNDNVDTNENGLVAKNKNIDVDEPAGPPPASVSVDASPKSTSKPLPPWKRPGAKKQQTAQPDVEVILVESAPKRCLQSDIPSTFTGERGGSAEDPELLALLRGVSANSAGSRFDDEHSAEPHFSQTPNVEVLDQVRDDSSIRKFVPPWKRAPLEKKNQEPNQMYNTQAESVLTGPPEIVESSGTGNGDSLVTKENLVQSLSDKKWSVRCQAYEFLSTILLEKTTNSDDLVDSDNILVGLDGLVPDFLKDNNASALDKALEFSILYAEHCRGAGSAEQASKITVSMLQKNAFSSRPSTLKLANNLTLKLMEVGDDGVSSVNSVIEALLNEGLSSKKPKVVQASASLVLEAAYHFGAATLPLASIASAANKLLSHSNAKVRECGICIVAEICRALGSKSPIQNVIDGMKSAQIVELDALLARQPEPTPAKTGLRSRKGNPKASSASEALAVLQTGKKGLEAQRYASRPAINLVAVVAKSDYSSQIAATKWSQKVAACETIIQGAGEKPFKLVQPSSTVNYAPIISDMKALFQHTHFAVRSKATEVLAMLAEGAGQHLYSHLRPLLMPLLDMSKDKKLTKNVSDCLDSFFGNVLSFENILDKDDALPSALDEKKQKNALVRLTALEFLVRCVRRNGEAGPKGALSSVSASEIASLCAEKLDDSDASVRKTAHECLNVLLQASDPKVLIATQKIIESLKSSNPRAYKALSRIACSETLKQTTESPPISNDSSNTVTVPVRGAPPKANAQKISSSHINSASATMKTADLTKAQLSVAEKVRSNFSSKELSAAMNASIEQGLTQQNQSAPHLEQAIMHVTGLRIPLWDVEEDGGGILEGLKCKFSVDKFLLSR